MIESRVVKWAVPTLKHVKINVDSMLREIDGGKGMVVRNFHGNVMAALAYLTLWCILL